MANKNYATNKRARFDYDLQDTYLAGLVLAGHEVKSIRNSNASLKGAYVTISANGEAWLTNSHVNPYPHATNLSSYDPERPRKLLLHKSEIERLKAARDNKYVIVPLSLHAAGPHVKLALATGKPKKLHDKRQTIKKRDTDRDVRRELK